METKSSWYYFRGILKKLHRKLNVALRMKRSRSIIIRVKIPMKTRIDALSYHQQWFYRRSLVTCYHARGRSSITWLNTNMAEIRAGTKLRLQIIHTSQSPLWMRHLILEVSKQAVRSFLLLSEKFEIQLILFLLYFLCKATRLLSFIQIFFLHEFVKISLCMIDGTWFFFYQEDANVNVQKQPLLATPRSCVQVSREVEPGSRVLLSCSSLTERKELLYHLENKSNIQLQTYDDTDDDGVLRRTGSDHPDLLLSPSAGIVFLFLGEKNLDGWLQKVLAMVIQCQMSHLIVQLNFLRWVSLTVTPGTFLELWVGHD